MDASTEQIMKTLKNIQKELENQKITIQQTGESVTERIQKSLDEKFCLLEEKYENLKERVENQEQRLYFLEKHARERHLVFFGIEDHDKSYFQLENTFLQFIRQHFTVTLDSRDIESLKRIGKKSEKSRPIVASFTTLRKKIEVLKQKKKLENTCYYITEDYPSHILKIRKELQAEAKLEREKGNKVIIKYDKLIIQKNESKGTPRTSKKKRNLSLSPQNASDPHKEPCLNTQSSKKNKTSKTAEKQRGPQDSIVKPGILNFLVSKNPISNSHTKDQDST